MVNPIQQFGGSGPLLHFAHGNGYPAGTYRQFIQPLTAHYQVEAIAHRPVFTPSPPDSLLEWKEMADDLIATFDAKGWRQLIGVGHSMGAVITMHAARQRPDLFSHVILIDPVFYPPETLDTLRRSTDPEPFADHPMVRTALRRRHRWASRSEALAYFRSKSVYDGMTDAAMDDFLDYGLKEDDGELTLAYPREWEARIYERPPRHVWEVITQVTPPLLLLRGSKTDVLDDPRWELLQSRLPNASFAELAQTGHLVPMEAPAKLAALVMEWLAK